MNKIKELDKKGLLATVESGSYIDLEKQLNDHGYTAGHEPIVLIFNAGWLDIY